MTILNFLNYLQQAFAILNFAVSPLSMHGAIASTPVRTPVRVNEVQSFADQPTGIYRYTTPNRKRLGRTLLLRKSGSVVIGVELYRGRDRSCFRGQAKGDRIVYVTYVYPPYNPASDWKSGQVLEIAPLISGDVRNSTIAEQTALDTCIQFFWR